MPRREDRGDTHHLRERGTPAYQRRGRVWNPPPNASPDRWRQACCEAQTRRAVPLASFTRVLPPSGPEWDSPISSGSRRMTWIRDVSDSPWSRAARLRAPAQPPPAALDSDLSRRHVVILHKSTSGALRSKSGRFVAADKVAGLGASVFRVWSKRGQRAWSLGRV